MPSTSAISTGPVSPASVSIAQFDIDSHLPRLAQLRHRLHQIPELGYEEFQTAAAIRHELDRLGITHIDGVANAPTATIAIIGDPAKPCIALRADIDALPIVEKTKLPYASRHDGCMHACGHDGHTTTLLGAAAVLHAMRDELAVCVKFLWQPAEESGGGAKRLVDAGVLDGRVGPKVRAIFGLHGWPRLKVGQISTKPGTLLAATDRVTATFVGAGCHGATPHLGRDPIVAACEAVLNLQQFVSREFDPFDPAVITVGVFHAGTAVNIIPDTARIEATVRTNTSEARKQIAAAIERRCRGIASACGCELEFEWIEGYPPTINDPAMSDFVAEIARRTFGAANYLPARGTMGGEDFAYYLEKVPGCFFIVGVEPPEKNEYPPLHNDRYDFTDATIGVGMRMFVELARNFPVK